jgi:hypothetical protein
MEAQRQPRERSRNGDYSYEGAEREFGDDAGRYESDLY